jgi:crotonobetainyl-CoA:carnitine CoA-transferase CaiB-like acyl-CoA transferase
VTPWRFDGATEAKMTPQPLRGQHNSYLLEELLGLPEGEIEALVEEQVVY